MPRVVLCLAVLAALLAPAVASQQVARCAIDLTFADGAVQTVGGRGTGCCAPVGRVVNGVPYAGYVVQWAPDASCDRQDLTWQRFYEGPLCTGPPTVNRRPTFTVGSVWICAEEDPPKPKAPATPAAPSLAGKRFVFRSMTTRQCLSSREGVALLGQPRVLQTACNEGDAAQGWIVRSAGGDGGQFYTIENPRGCLTTYSGFSLRAAVVMRCSGGADQRWALDSRTPNGKGPYTIRSPLTGACLSNVGKELVQVKCDPEDMNDLFESAFVA